jgi:hypothetical protein
MLSTGFLIIVRSSIGMLVISRLAIVSRQALVEPGKNLLPRFAVMIRAALRRRTRGGSAYTSARLKIDHPRLSEATVIAAQTPRG